MVHFSVSCAGKLSNIRPTLVEASGPRGTCEKAIEGQMMQIDENSRTALNMTLCGGLRLPLFAQQRLRSNIALRRDHLNRKLCSKELGKGLDPQLSAVYCAHGFQIFSGKKHTMSVRAVEEVSAQVPADDFQALEEKVYRTIELYKAARDARAVAERDVQRLREQIEEREEEVDSLKKEMITLRREREEVRSRVEKMLRQIDAMGAEEAAAG
jgi:hypothetical protein